MSERTVDGWRDLLRTALRDAARARDADAVAVLRETLAAIDNAEAVDAGAVAAPTEHGRIAGAVSGLGAGEVARRHLTPAEVRALVERELADLRAAADSYRQHGRADEAATLDRRAAVVAALLAR